MGLIITIEGRSRISLIRRKCKVGNLIHVNDTSSYHFQPQSHWNPK